jgi:large subunit ribosomal protein L19e
MRRHLQELRDQGRIDVHAYRRFYRQAKGGMFKSRAHLDQQLRAAGAVREAAK